MSDDWKFDFYKGKIEVLEELIEIVRDLMLHSERVTDYWSYLNKLNKLEQEKYIWEQMAKEKGFYIV
jgi:hypothetical protein